MAIDVIAPPDSVHVGDTVVIHLRALNRAGDSIVGATIALISLTPDTLGIDSARGAVVGKAVGPGRAIARSGDLVSTPFAVLVK